MKPEITEDVLRVAKNYSSKCVFTVPDKRKDYVNVVGAVLSDMSILARFILSLCPPPPDPRIQVITYELEYRGLAAMDENQQKGLAQRICNALDAMKPPKLDEE